MTRAPSKLEAGGVAMIVVLMITAILAMFLMQTTLSAKARVARSQAIVDQSTALLAVRSAESTLLFRLMTGPWVENAGSSSLTDLPIKFFGEKFDLEGVDVVMDDVGGLLTVPSPGSSAQSLGRLMLSLGFPSEKVDRLVERIEAMPEPPARLPFQDLSELAQLGALSSEELDRLRAYVTLTPAPTFNPRAASQLVLLALYDGTIAEALADARGAGRLDEISFNRILGGGGDDLIAFTPGPTFRIRLAATVGATAFSRQITVRLRPVTEDPIELLEVRYGAPWRVDKAGQPR
jgi:type II secretory pathway component PulK